MGMSIGLVLVEGTLGNTVLQPFGSRGLAEDIRELAHSEGVPVSPNFITPIGDRSCDDWREESCAPTVTDCYNEQVYQLPVEKLLRFSNHASVVPEGRYYKKRSDLGISRVATERLADCVRSLLILATTASASV